MIMVELKNIVHKNVISKDGELIGKVIAASQDSITVASHDRLGHVLYTYVIPKSRIKGYNNGSEILLNMHFIIIDKYRV